MSISTSEARSIGKVQIANIPTFRPVAGSAYTEVGYNTIVLLWHPNRIAFTAGVLANE